MAVLEHGPPGPLRRTHSSPGRLPAQPARDKIQQRTNQRRGRLRIRRKGFSEAAGGRNIPSDATATSTRPTASARWRTTSISSRKSLHTLAPSLQNPAASTIMSSGIAVTITQRKGQIQIRRHRHHLDQLRQRGNDPPATRHQPAPPLSLGFRVQGTMGSGWT